jgi:hypothetical protein
VGVRAYVLIQTEVDKAAGVTTAVAQIPGIVHAQDVTGPYDVIAQAEAESMERAGQDSRGPRADDRWHHENFDMPGGQPLTGSLEYLRTARQKFPGVPASA